MTKISNITSLVQIWHFILPYRPRL